MAIESNRENTTSVKKMFLKGDEVSSRVSEDFHTLDCQDCFVGIKVDVLMKLRYFHMFLGFKIGLSISVRLREGGLKMLWALEK